jgi:hypothetical protein
MQIPYNIRESSFLVPCIEAIEKNRVNLARGSYIVIHFDSDADGFPGQYQVDIDPHDSRFFEARPEIGNPSYFGARIKAAATALRNCRLTGSFDIWHEKGTLRLRKA